VAETGQPYAFTGDDPLNSTDPLGLCHTKKCSSYEAALLRRIRDSRHGYVTLDESQVNSYFRKHGFSKAEAGNYTRSFDWDEPVKAEELPAGFSTLNYSSSPTGGRTLFTTATLFSSPGSARGALALPSSNTANFVRPVIATTSTPILAGDIGGSTGGPDGTSVQQYVIGSYDTDTYTLPGIPTSESSSLPELYGLNFLHNPTVH